MKLVHSAARLENARKIILEGIKSPRLTGIREHNFPENSDVVCFTALEEDESLKRIWGDYHFVLNPRWFVQNLSQFREHKDDFNSKRFEEFLRETRLQAYGKKSFPETYNQVLSLAPVPLQGIAELVIPETEVCFFNDIILPKSIRLSTYEKVD